MDAECFDDLSEFGAELDDPFAELIQDLYHRLIEEPGSNLDDPDRGVGITNKLSGTFDSSIGAEIEADFRKDERVGDCTVIVTEKETPGHYRLDITVDTDDARLGLVVEADANTGVVRRVL